MADKIKVLIADDIAATRENITKLIEFQPEVIVVGEAATAEGAINQAKQLQPDIILMDINMPGMDGIEATQILSTDVPNSAIIIMSVQGEQEYLRRAMIAGAKDYLVKPFTGDELIQAVRQSHANEQKRRNVAKTDNEKAAQPGKIITVFSTKGGIGKTTIATNLAVALADRMGYKVGLVDGDLQFGDVSLFLNIMPQATIADLVKDKEGLDETLLKEYLTFYSDKVKVLAAPFRPEQAETISGQNLTDILKTMRTMFDYIVVDTAPVFNDAILAILDSSDMVLVVSSMDLPTIKNVKLCLEIMESINYSKDKIKLILNRANSEGGMEQEEVEETLHDTFMATVPSEGKVVVLSVNRGIPFVVSHPDSDVAKSIYYLAELVSGAEIKPKEEQKGVVGRLKRFFG